MFSFNRYAMIGFFAASLATIGVIAVSVCGSHPKQIMAHSPMVHVAHDRVDLGVVRPSETREVAFLIENKGLRRLVLNEIRCGCGSPIRPAIVVLPGKTEIVPISLETGVESGEIEKKLSFATNDTTLPRIDLTVVGNVIDL